jgi:hypothetical protein
MNARIDTSFAATGCGFRKRLYEIVFKISRGCSWLGGALRLRATAAGIRNIEYCTTVLIEPTLSSLIGLLLNWIDHGSMLERPMSLRLVPCRSI